MSSHVLVIFEASTEATEQLALALGVGAVEAQAAIRLRRLVEDGSPQIGHKGYGELSGADLTWATAAAIVVEGEQPTPLLTSFAETLTTLAIDLKGKPVALLGPESSRALFRQILSNHGITPAIDAPLSTPEAANAYGHTLASS